MTTPQQQDSLANFMAMCNCDADQARHFLEACDWNVENATNLFFETGGVAPSTPSSSTTQSQQYHQVEEEEVRNPIPQTTGRLLDWDDGSAMSTVPTELSDMRSFLPQQRDVRPPQDRFVADSEQFGQLFEPPRDILFAGSFDAAKSKAEQEQKWLLVNIQNDEFASLQLNRDTWKDDVLQSVIQVYCLFWQAHHNSTQGQRFCTLYKVDSQLPLVALIDPRTGEKMKQWTGFIEPRRMIEDLQVFVEVYDMTGAGFPDHTSTTATAGSSSSRTSSIITGTDSGAMGDMDLTEDALLRQAIQASLEDSVRFNGEQQKESQEQQLLQQDAIIVDDDSDEEMEEEEKEDQPADLQIDYAQYTQAKEGDVTRLRLRHLDGQNEVITILRDAPLASLYAIVRQKLPEEERLKPFKIVFMNNDIENTLDKTLRSENINNASLSAMFE